MYIGGVDPSTRERSYNFMLLPSLRVHEFVDKPVPPEPEGLAPACARRECPLAHLPLERAGGQSGQGSGFDKRQNGRVGAVQAAVGVLDFAEGNLVAKPRLLGVA